MVPQKNDKRRNISKDHLRAVRSWNTQFATGWKKWNAQMAKARLAHNAFSCTLRRAITENEKRRGEL